VLEDTVPPQHARTKSRPATGLTKRLPQDTKTAPGNCSNSFQMLSDIVRRYMGPHQRTFRRDRLRVTRAIAWPNQALDRVGKISRHKGGTT
jgi:hypothetical protein